MSLCVTVVEMSQKDDLESLGYILVCMITGTLPWKDLIGVKLGDGTLDQQIKLRNPKIICQGLPSNNNTAHDINKQ